MSLLEEAFRVRGLLARIPAVEVHSYEHGLPVETSEVQRLELLLGQSLPVSLRQTWEEKAGHIRLNWRTEGDVFGPACRRGFLELNTPDGVFRKVQVLREIVEDVDRGEMSGDEEGMAALLQDWPHWISIFSFRNGDAFCLDLRSVGGDLPVVLLEHDVMDAGPSVHGLKVASDFDGLVRAWSDLAFIELRDWSEGVSQEGLDLALPVFARLREHLLSQS